MSQQQSEKQKAVELAVASIEKQFGRGSIMRLGTDESLVQDIPAPDAGTDAGEEHSARPQHAPEFSKHRAEVAFIAGEVKYGVAEDDVGEGIGEGHLLDCAGLEIFGRQGGREHRGKLADVGDPFGVAIEGEDLAALAQQVDEVATVAAAGVEDPHAGLNIAAQNLIEDIDIDLAELFLNAD